MEGNTLFFDIKEMANRPKSAKLALSSRFLVRHMGEYICESSHKKKCTVVNYRIKYLKLNR